MAIRSFFEQLPEKYWRCRTRPHYWGPSNVIEHKKERELEVVEVCDCGATRHQYLDMRKSNHGHIKEGRTHIRYPEGYLQPPKNGGWMNKDEKGMIRMKRYGY